MTAFDATTREVCVSRRERTSTPLQALVLLNDPQFVEAARVLAEQLIRTRGDALSARVEHAFRLLTSRAPTQRETEVLLRLYREQHDRFLQSPMDAAEFLAVGEVSRDPQMDVVDLAATTVLVTTLMNMDECVTKR
jgi:hypothetical protein